MHRINKKMKAIINLTRRLSRLSPHALGIAVVCIVSLAITLTMTWKVFDAVPHLEDEAAQYFQAKVFAAGRITAPVYQTFDAFFVPFTIQESGRVFSKYPPGHALLLAVGVLVRLPWLVNPLATALGLLGLYFLGKELFDETSGLLAAVLGLISPMSVMLSGTYLVHPVCLALLTWFTWAFLKTRRALVDRTREQGTAPHQTLSIRRYILLAGVLGGLAIAVRPYSAAGIGLPFVLLGIADILRSFWRGIRRSAPQSLPDAADPGGSNDLPLLVILRRIKLSGQRTIHGLSLLSTYLWMSVICLLAASPWLVYNTVVAGRPIVNTYQLYWSYDGVGFGPQFGLDGHTWQEGIENIYLDLFQFYEMATGWPIIGKIPILVVVLGLGLALPRRSRWEAFLLLPVASLVLANAAYWTRSAGLYGPRYIAEAMPFVWLLAARGLVKLGRWRWARWGIGLGLIAGLTWSVNFLLVPRFAQAHDLYGIDRDDAKILQQARLVNALVFVEAPDWTDYARLSWLNPPVLEQAEVIYARKRDVESNRIVAAQFPGRVIYIFDRRAAQQLQVCEAPCAFVGGDVR